MADQRLVHVGLAGEGDDLRRGGWRVGCSDVAERPGGDEALFEADAPIERIHLEGAERAAAEGLAVVVFLEHTEWVGAEAVPNLGLRSDVVAEDGHVADAGAGLRPVFRDDVFSVGLVVEEIVDGAGDNEVHV